MHQKDRLLLRRFCFACLRIALCLSVLGCATLTPEERKEDLDSLIVSKESMIAIHNYLDEYTLNQDQRRGVAAATQWYILLAVYARHRFHAETPQLSAFLARMTPHITERKSISSVDNMGAFVKDFEALSHDLDAAIESIRANPLN